MSDTKPKLTFSQRYGYTPMPQILQREEMTDALRNSLWNVLYSIAWYSHSSGSYQGLQNYCAALYSSYLKLPLDTLPSNQYGISWIDTRNIIRIAFFSFSWFQIYDFLEFTLNYFGKPRVNAAVNQVLERELAGYRFVEGVFLPIIGEQEIKSIESALQDQGFPFVREHLKRAMELLSDRQNPDYRNSIKESISAVESIVKDVSGKPKAAFDVALKEIERAKNLALHPALDDAFRKLYGYTSDADGIRHAMLEESKLTAADAQYFLVVCSAFINYLKSKI